MRAVSCGKQVAVDDPSGEEAEEEEDKKLEEEEGVEQDEETIGEEQLSCME